MHEHVTLDKSSVTRWPTYLKQKNECAHESPTVKSVKASVASV